MTYEEIENWEYLRAKIHDEGFDYCYVHYSDWSEIKDEKFHKLRKKYLKAQKKLSKYVNKIVLDSNDEW
jgi:hypothetical protein